VDTAGVRRGATTHPVALLEALAQHRIGSLCGR
jgi:hypothetical protein